MKVGTERGRKLCQGELLDMHDIYRPRLTWFRWHQDVKPTNILVKSRQGATSMYDMEFMLADLGLSHFKLSNSPNKSLTDRDTYGTRAYGMSLLEPVVSIFSLMNFRCSRGS